MFRFRQPLNVFTVTYSPWIFGFLQMKTACGLLVLMTSMEDSILEGWSKKMVGIDGHYLKGIVISWGVVCHGSTSFLMVMC